MIRGMATQKKLLSIVVFKTYILQLYWYTPFSNTVWNWLQNGSPCPKTWSTMTDIMLNGSVLFYLTGLTCVPSYPCLHSWSEQSVFRTSPAEGNQCYQDEYVVSRSQWVDSGQELSLKILPWSIFILLSKINSFLETIINLQAIHIVL